MHRDGPGRDTSGIVVGRQDPMTQLT